MFFFFFASRRRHTSSLRDWSSDVCSSDLLTPFSGRHDELESLRQALRSAARREGQVIGISGDPGLGKSRLVHELRLVAEAGTVALQARCLPFGTAVPYLPILDLVREACGI